MFESGLQDSQQPSLHERKADSGWRLTQRQRSRGGCCVAPLPRGNAHCWLHSGQKATSSRHQRRNCMSQGGAAVVYPVRFRAEGGTGAPAGHAAGHSVWIAALLRGRGPRTPSAATYCLGKVKEVVDLTNAATAGTTWKAPNTLFDTSLPAAPGIDGGGMNSGKAAGKATKVKYSRSATAKNTWIASTAAGECSRRRHKPLSPLHRCCPRMPVMLSRFHNSSAVA